MNEKNESNTSNILDYASFNRPCFGERVSGDKALIDENNGFILLGMIDGLGHGQNAYLISAQIEKFLRENWSADLKKTLLQLHEHCKGTIGAAVGLGVLEINTGQLSYTGVGNTVIRVLGKQSKRLPSSDGVIGTCMRTPVIHKLNLTSSDILLLYTDGIKDRFEIEDYRSILYENPKSLVQNIVRRFGKKHDDATCILLKYKK